jgi:hypothetical protein
MSCDLTRATLVTSVLTLSADSPAFARSEFTRSTIWLSSSDTPEGAGVAIGLAVGAGVAVGLAVGAGVAVGLAVGAGVAVGLAVGAGVAVGLAVGAGVAVGAIVGIGSGVAVGLAVGAGVAGAGVSVGSGAFVGAGVGQLLLMRSSSAFSPSYWAQIRASTFSSTEEQYGESFTLPGAMRGAGTDTFLAAIAGVDVIVISNTQQIRPANVTKSFFLPFFILTSK